MGKFHLNKLPKEKRIQMIGEFYDVIDSLKNRGEIRLFFKDLLTPDEIATLMRRIEVATLLMANFTYQQIAGMLGVGRGKVTNVQRSLARNGEGYKVAVKRLLEKRKRKLKQQKKWEKAGISPFECLKQKQPVYYCLFNLIDEISEVLSGSNTAIEKEALINTPSRSYFRKGENSTTN